MKNLSVMDGVFGVLGGLELMETDLRQPLDSDSECPHDLSVTHDDDSLIAAITAQGVECVLDTNAHVGK